MSEPMKKHLTDFVKVTIGEKRPRLFLVPKEKAHGLAQLLKEFEKDMVSAEEAFKDLHAKYTKAGTVLQGLRLRDELTQKDLAAKLKIKQSHISEMETGARPIGKVMAKRLAKAFKTDYRVFL